jgi:hypothetical protein
MEKKVREAKQELDNAIKSKHSLSLNLLPALPQDEKEAQSIEFESQIQHVQDKKRRIEQSSFQMNPKSSNLLMSAALTHFNQQLSNNPFGQFHSSATEHATLVKKKALVSYSSEEES